MLQALEVSDEHFKREGTMPPSFDDKLTINQKGDIDPKGPLDDLAGRGLDAVPKSKVHIHFWITQQQGDKLGAFMQGQAMLDPDDPTRSRWKTRTPDTVDSGGTTYDLIHR